MELEIDGETFRVEVDGPADRPAVVLSPSLGADLSLFDAQLPALREHFRVVRYDPRGHGGSTTAGAPYALARLGRDVVAILDALGIEAAHFIGISMGGLVGQWLLVHAPERIGRAVLANTAARIYAPEAWNGRIATALAKGTSALAPATMERWFSPAFHARAPKRVAAVDAVFRATSAEGYAGACAALRDADLREAIRSIDRPVLVVSGREDAVTSAADADAMVAAIRGAAHVELDCRHISIIEQDQAFNDAVVAFLTAPSPAQAPRPRAARTKVAPRRAATGRATAARSPLKPARASSRVGGGEPPSRARPAGPAKVARRASRGALAEAATTKPAKAKAGTKKTPAKSAKKAQRKPAARRTSAGRPARKTAAVRASSRTAVSKKMAKKSAARKTTAKKTAAKKVVAKKTAARPPAARRRPSPKRPGRPGGRKR